MAKTIYIPVGNKKIPLTYRPDPNYDGAIIVDCDAAGLHQGFLMDDLGGLIENIPHMVEKCKAKKESFVKIRVTSEEKEKLSELSAQKGYNSISAYMRAVALS